jgi:hypothetical protein
MEPLRPEERALALAAPVPDADALLAEYELLLAQRFAQDPDAPALAPMGAAPDPEARLAELHALLFRHP